MAYEKFIKKDGKIYGPYIYHSKRVDGRVVSEYHGSGKQNNYSKFFILAAGVFILVAVLYLLAPEKNLGITGKTILDLDANYQKDKPLEGKIKLSLQEGELIPASSKLVLENNGKTFEYNLKDLTTEETTSGNFYVAGIQVSGSGDGYGIRGEREIYPEVYFTLSVLSEQTSSETSTETPTPEEQQTQTTEEPETAGILSTVSSFFLGLTPEITGNAIVELENEVQDSVSKEKPFSYKLEENQRAEIKPRSVRTDSKQLDDNEIQLEIKNGEAVVTTRYSEKDSGFGPEYIGSGKKEIEIDISKLDIVLEEGNLKIMVFDQNQELISLTTSLKEEGNINAETQVETPIQIPETTTEPETVVENKIPTQEEPLELTLEEKAILEDNFGNASLDVKEATLKNGFITVRYELGDYWIENSYDASLSNETFNLFMERDKVKWLKDIAKKLSQEEESEKSVEEFVSNLT